MRKAFSLFIFPLVFFSAHGQSFQKGNTVVNVGTGLAIYGVYTYEKNTPYYSNDTAGSYIFPVKLEYGIFNWLGAAFRFNYSNYIEGDSANTQDVNGIDLGVQAN